MREATRALYRAGVVAEVSGAAAVAAVLAGKLGDLALTLTLTLALTLTPTPTPTPAPTKTLNRCLATLSSHDTPPRSMRRGLTASRRWSCT